jgi:hypothetical protein
MAKPAAKTSVLRISSELSEAAERAGAKFQRKGAQQIEYWASLGRALEALPGITHRKIEAALTAALDFDELSTEERAIALARLGHMELNRRAPPRKPSRAGTLYTRDQRGQLVRVLPSGKREAVKDPLKTAKATARKR